MSLSDLVAIIVGVATVYFMRQQNEIFRRQNQIFAAQASGQALLPDKPTGAQWLKIHWPIIAMTLIMLLTWATLGYEYYDRHFGGPSQGLQWQPWTALLIGVLFIVAYSVYQRRAGLQMLDQTKVSQGQARVSSVNAGNTPVIPTNAGELIWVWRGMVTDAQEISRSKGIEVATTLIALPHYPSLRPHLSEDLKNRIESIQLPVAQGLNATHPIVKGILDTIDRLEATWQLATGRPAVNTPMEAFSQFRLDSNQLSQLGSATSAARSIPSGYLYQAWYEHAIIVWSFSPSVGFYRLPVSGANWTWIPDPEWGTSSAPAWRNDADLRKRFEDRFQVTIPKDLSPPYAGEAFRWWKDPDAWSWIGWRISNTIFEPDTDAPSPALPVYQEFEHGLVIGGLVMAKDGTEAMRLVLFYENAERTTGRWKLGPMDANAPKCKTPP